MFNSSASDLKTRAKLTPVSLCSMTIRRSLRVRSIKRQMPIVALVKWKKQTTSPNNCATATPTTLADRENDPLNTPNTPKKEGMLAEFRVLRVFRGRKWLLNAAAYRRDRRNPRL